MTFPFTSNGFPSGRGNSDRLKRPKLTISNLSDTGLTVSWEAVDDATGYKVFVNQVEVYSGANLTFNVTGLDPWISNAIQVKAFNVEKESSFALFIKPSKTLQQPVLNLVSKTDTTINLSGTNPDSLPNVELYQNGTLISEGLLTTWELTGLNPETSYTYTMRVGSGGNWSPMSTPLTVVMDEAGSEPEVVIRPPYPLDSKILNVSSSMGFNVPQVLQGMISQSGGTPDLYQQAGNSEGLKDFWNDPMSGADVQADVSNNNYDILVISDGSGSLGDFESVSSYGIKWFELAESVGTDVYFYRIWGSSTADRLTGDPDDWSTYYDYAKYRVAVWDKVVSDMNQYKKPDTQPIKTIPMDKVMVRIYEDMYINNTAPTELVNATLMIFHGGVPGTSTTDGHPSSVGWYLISLAYYCTLFQQKCTMPYSSSPYPSNRTFSDATAEYLQDVVWEIISTDPQTGFNEVIINPDYAVTQEKVDYLTVYKAPSNTNSLILLDGSNTSSYPITSLPQDIPIPADGVYQIGSDTSPSTSEPVSGLITGTSPIEFIGSNWYTTGNFNTGVTAQMPAGIQAGDLLIFFSVHNRHNSPNAFGRGVSNDPYYYGYFPNRFFSGVMQDLDSELKAISIGVDWGIYDPAIWGSTTVTEFAKARYVTAAIIVIRGANSLRLGNYSENRHIGNDWGQSVRDFIYPEISTVDPEGLIIDVATANIGGRGSSSSANYVQLWVEPNRLDYSLLYNNRNRDMALSVSRRYAKHPQINEEVVYSGGSTYQGTGVFRLIAENID